MRTPPVLHHQFTIERRFAAVPEVVFEAWRDPASKRAWFAGPEARHSLDFRVGGTETAAGRALDGADLAFESRYLEIDSPVRIIYASTLRHAGLLATASVTSVEFVPHGDGTRLVLTESDVFVEGRERPQWREMGTQAQLDALADLLERIGGATRG
jgi:uncharacterized protein YndB with AHSA1/START domain